MIDFRVEQKSWCSEEPDHDPNAYCVVLGEEHVTPIRPPGVVFPIADDLDYEDAVATAKALRWAFYRLPDKMKLSLFALIHQMCVLESPPQD